MSRREVIKYIDILLYYKVELEGVVGCYVMVWSFRVSEVVGSIKSFILVWFIWWYKKIERGEGKEGRGKYYFRE